MAKEDGVRIVAAQSLYNSIRLLRWYEVGVMFAVDN